MKKSLEVFFVKDGIDLEKYDFIFDEDYKEWRYFGKSMVVKMKVGLNSSKLYFNGLNTSDLVVLFKMIKDDAVYVLKEKEMYKCLLTAEEREIIQNLRREKK